MSSLPALVTDDLTTSRLFGVGIVASISYISSHFSFAEVCTHGRLEHLTQLVVQEAAGIGRLSSVRDLNVNINLVILSLPICRMGAFASAFEQPAVFHQASNAHRTALGSSQIPGSTHSVSRNIFPTSFCHESWRRYNPFATQLGLTGFPWRGFDHFCSYINHYKCLHLLASSWTCMTNLETNTSLAS